MSSTRKIPNREAGSKTSGTKDEAYSQQYVSQQAASASAARGRAQQTKNGGAAKAVPISAAVAAVPVPVGVHGTTCIYTTYRCDFFEVVYGGLFVYKDFVAPTRDLPFRQEKKRSGNTSQDTRHTFIATDCEKAAKNEKKNDGRRASATPSTKQPSAGYWATAAVGTKSSMGHDLRYRGV